MPPLPVSIVILNWNGKRFLEDCLSSVLAQEGGPFEVVLVDNGSSDGSPAFVRGRFPSVRVIEAGRNLGFAEGNNLGVRSAAGEIIVLLNNDTVVAPGWLAALLRAMERPEVVLAESRVLTEGVPERYYEQNGSLNFVGHNIMRVFARRENTFFCSGASLAFRKSVFGEPFDPEFFLYSEDVYLGLRARFMGYSPLHVDESVVRHAGGGSTAAKRSAMITMYQERNRLLNFLYFFSPWTLLRILPFWILNAGAKFALACVGRRYSVSGLIRGYWWVLAHPGFIRRRRRELRTERKGGEREVLGWMTGKMTNGESFAGKVVNALAVTYCRLVGLRTIEREPVGTR